MVGARVREREDENEPGTFGARGCPGEMRNSRTFSGLGVFLLYCALLAVAGPAMFWSARLGRHLAPVRVHRFVGYFVGPGGDDVSHVAIPLEDGTDLVLSGGEIPGVISAGTTIEKRRGELAFRFDGEPAEWPLQGSHLALGAGGLGGLVGIALLLGRSRLAGTRLRALGWLAAPGRVGLLLLPGMLTLVIGVVAAFLRGDLDRVTAVATLGAAVVGGMGGHRGTWRRLRERVVLARARRLAAGQTAGVERAVGIVRRVEPDFIELQAGLESRWQAALGTCERLGLGPLPHPPLAVGDRVEVIGTLEYVIDPTAEASGRGVALAGRLCASEARPVLIARAPEPKVLATTERELRARQSSAGLTADVN